MIVADRRAVINRIITDIGGNGERPALRNGKGLADIAVSES